MTVDHSPSRGANQSGLDLNLLKKRSEESLYFFTKGILGYDWLVPHIHKNICDRLMDKNTNRQVFVLPRGWLKTTICTVAYPIWLSIHDPDIRVLITQNSADNAFKKLNIIKSQWLENALLRSMYPELLPTSSSIWRSNAACLNRSKSHPEATYEAAGTNTKIVSRHYDVIIEDDTIAPDLDDLGIETLAPSYQDVAQAIGWHRTNVLPILTNIDKGRVLVVGTRWYEFDLIDWVISNEPHYEVVTRACRENKEGLPDACGEITYPERFNGDVLRELETSMGPYLFSCLYMNMPIRVDDMLFKPEWIQYYETPPPPNSTNVFTTVDPATDPKLAKGKDIDYTVVMTCAKDNARGWIYVLDYTRVRCNPGELVQEIFRHVRAYNPVLVGYEDIAFQRSLEYWIREVMRQENLYFILEKVPGTHRDKNSKIAGLQPIFANGDIFIRSHMKELVSELQTFPHGQHDDVVDALAMQTSFWRTTYGIEPENQREDTNPLSFERAMKEIANRKKAQQTLKSCVFDPARTNSTLRSDPGVFTPQRGPYGI